MKLRTPVLRTACLLAVWISCAGAGVAHAADAAKGGNAQAGRDKVSMCIGCHGIADYKTAFPEVYRVPMIAGQNAKYIENALNAYKKGERSHPTMDAVAGSLSDQDIADIAAYYANLK
ncbi:c-type cytochrome [Bordetella genomosp. 11]|uniref:Cytochrome C n=1 Tax=Bordetella genomosp. 11 TaxID=1416808 RepID=A0A261UL40_9BORD|nr:cytochrome c [Bordetella genomosp. 11]OZI61990.1 cytochrome C [Bordetella genomosp. 11]